MAGDMKLSQAEIDALLSGSASETAEPSSDAPLLSDFEKDALGEIGNISFGSAATALSTLLQQRVDITTPDVTLLRQDLVHNEFPRPYVLVSVEFTEGLSGFNALAIELQDAKTIADLMLGGDGTHVAGELNELHLSAVGEAMNQMMGSAATAMSNIFGRTINISPPRVEVVDLSSVDSLDMGHPEWIVDVAFQLKVGTLIDSKIMQLVPFEFARDLVNALNALNQAPGQDPNPVAGHKQGMTGDKSAQKSATPTATQTPTPMAGRPVDLNTPNQPMGYGNTAGLSPVAAMAGQEMAVGLDTAHSVAESTMVRRPEFADFSQQAPVSMKEQRNLSLLFDVPLTVTVELGRTKKTIKDILDMSSGAILELDKLAGEPVDILVNNKRIAIGEVVVIDENFGVRVTDILSPVDRVRNLQ